MKITPNYNMLKGLLTERVSWQPNSITIGLPKVVSGGDFADFTGENVINYDYHTLKTFYNVMSTSTEREKFGVSSKVDIIFYISPTNFKDSTGKDEFTKRLKKTKGAKIVFREDSYKITDILNIERVGEEGDENTVHIAIQINASKL